MMPRLASLARTSPDPSTQNAAIVVSRLGDEVEAVNGFTPGLEIHPVLLEPPMKYLFIEHAERAAIQTCARLGITTSGASMWALWAACADCARAIVNSGVTRLTRLQAPRGGRWTDSILAGDRILAAAGVEVVELDPSIALPGIRAITVAGGRWLPDVTPAD